MGWKQAQELKSQKTAKAPSADDGKYLILHADDAGMSHNVNVATIETMTKGIASSCSIMVPCPWFPEFAKYARENPKLDYGIHLTVNSEWKHFRWGPVAPREKVPSLLDKDGYLWPDVPDVALNAKASEVEIELHAQIDRALKFGVPLSHLDTHMGSLVSRPDLIEVYVNTALKYKLPILWTRVRSEESLRKYPALKENLDKLTKALEDAGLPVLDTLTTGVNGDDLETRKRAYLKVIREFKPGVHQIIIHCGVGNEELKAITGRWSQRDEDRRIFTDPAVIAEVQKAGVKLIGWKDAREMLRVRTAQAE
ncbi:MAG: polysaccharide deacetylase family protein [Planctomycetaceae bacterium]